MTNLSRSHAAYRILLGYAIYTLIFVAGVSGGHYAHAGSGSLQLPIHNLDVGVHLPFPIRPQLLDIFTESGSRSAAYQYTDERASFGYTATIMLDRLQAPQSRSPEEWIKRTIRGVLDAIDGRAIVEKDVIVDGRHARYVFASMGIVDHQAHSRTLVIFDNGRVHTWAMQDVPAITGELGSQIFLENINRIRIDSGAGASTQGPRPDGLYSLGRVLLPFPGAPEAIEVSMPSAETEALTYQGSRGSSLYMGLALTGLPRVADPAYTFLRGARFEKELIENGDVTIAGMEAKYQIIRDIGSETRHTYAVAWSYGDALYVWNIHRDHSPKDRSVRDEFFQSMKRIEIR